MRDRLKANGLRTAFLLAGATLGLCMPAGAEPPAGTITPSNWPLLPRQHLATPPVMARVDALLAAMSLEEKVGQLIQADIGSITPDDLRIYPLGSILAGGNSGPGDDDRAPPLAWLALADAYHRVAVERRPGHVPIPLLFGIDAVHGNNNVPGATLFPHNIGLGAARDPDLVRRIAAATAEEVAVTGIDWTFAPTLAVARDVRWGRTYESFSEDPRVVRDYAGAIVEGLQGRRGTQDFQAPGHTIATAKHFLADGGTQNGRDQGDSEESEQALIDIHAAGYGPAIQAGVLTIMVSYSSWQGTKMTANKALLTDVLKERLGFEGLVVTDWNALGQVPGCTRYDCAAAINAGIDMVMAPDSWKPLYENLLGQVRAGVIPAARLDDAVRRVLLVKALSGVLDEAAPSARPGAGRFDRLASAEHRALAREAVRKSLVLLKNERGLLPLKRGLSVLVTGDGADNIPKQAGGWTVSWQGSGNSNADFPQATSIEAGLRAAVEAGGGHVEHSSDGTFRTRPDVAVVVFGEDPYAEYMGDLESLDRHPHAEQDLATLRSLKAQGVPVVAVLLSGRPLWVNPLLNLADAFVAAWLPGSEGGGVADLLVRAPDGTIRYDFTGKLAFSWPRSAVPDGKHPGDADDAPLFPVGYGLSYRQGPQAVWVQLPEDPGLTDEARLDRRAVLRRGRAIDGWSLYAADFESAERVTSARQASPRGIVTIEAQDEARQVTWAGGGEGMLRVEGRPTDLRKEAALVLRYRVDAMPTERVRWEVACGKNCSGAIDVTDALRAASPGAWSTLRVPLACFAQRGADLAKVERPLDLATSGRMQLTVAEILLDEEPGVAACPTQ
jgi:beta-glucosidase